MPSSKYFLEFHFFGTLFSLFFISINAAYPAQINLAWDAPGSDPAGYKLHYGTSSANYTKSVNVGKTTNHTISDLDEGNTYYLPSPALYLNQPESGYSNEASAYIPKSDSDADGIPDVDEINVTGTDPNKADTDGDGIMDGDELTPMPPIPTMRTRMETALMTAKSFPIGEKTGAPISMETASSTSWTRIRMGTAFWMDQRSSM